MKIKHCISIEFSAFSKHHILYTHSRNITAINKMVKEITPTAHVVSVKRVTITNEEFLTNNLESLAQWIKKIKS